MKSGTSGKFRCLLVRNKVRRYSRFQQENSWINPKQFIKIHHEGIEKIMKKKIYFNHDGGVDDLVSLFLLLKMDNVELTGVSVIPADCYLEPAVFASRKIIDRFGNGGLDVAESNSRGKNPFPKDWRMHAFYVDALPILNESGKIITPVAEKPAHLHMIDAIRNTEEKTTLLFTGPLN